jgi:hypothetical protein
MRVGRRHISAFQIRHVLSDKASLLMFRPEPFQTPVVELASE